MQLKRMAEKRVLAGDTLVCVSRPVLGHRPRRGVKDVALLRGVLNVVKCNLMGKVVVRI